jgi:putative sigma-54 modulation protein
MQIQISGRSNVDVTERLRSYAEKKVGRLDRYLPYITDLSLELSQERHRNGGDKAVAQLTVRDQRGTILRAEDKSQSDIFAAIDLVVDKIYRQISRYKGKKRRRAGERFADVEPELAAAEEIPDFEDTEDSDLIAQIVRRKHIELVPMSEEEAIDQMELLGHDFFVFYNANTGTTNVLYRRKGGDYGLLEPVIA